MPKKAAKKKQSLAPRGARRCRKRTEPAVPSERKQKEMRTLLIHWMAVRGFHRGLNCTIDDEPISNRPDEKAVRIRIWTTRYCYQIGAHLWSNYLGCIASCRAPEPGEDHTRGGDLADGDFSVNTLERIFADIAFYEALDVVGAELVRERLAKKKKRVPRRKRAAKKKSAAAA